MWSAGGYWVTGIKKKLWFNREKKIYYDFMFCLYFWLNFQNSECLKKYAELAGTYLRKLKWWELAGYNAVFSFSMEVWRTWDTDKSYSLTVSWAELQGLNPGPWSSKALLCLSRVRAGASDCAIRPAASPPQPPGQFTMQTCLVLLIFLNKFLNLP